MATKTKKQHKTAATRETASDDIAALIEADTRRFQKEVNIAGDWCAGHNVRLTVYPNDVLALLAQRDIIREAVKQAGGSDKVPAPVLLYEQTLDDAAHFLLDHGVGRAIKYLRGGPGPFRAEP